LYGYHPESQWKPKTWEEFVTDSGVMGENICDRLGDTVEIDDDDDDMPGW
jgi:hypothetical protein